MSTKSALDLLDLELVFSQRAPLSVSEFGRECGRRGWSLVGDSTLEALHRASLLVPLYRVRKSLRDVYAAHRRGDVSAAFAAEHAARVSTRGDHLKLYRDAGYLRDPRCEPFRPWQLYRRVVHDHHFKANEFYYSY